MTQPSQEFTGHLRSPFVFVRNNNDGFITIRVMCLPEIPVDTLVGMDCIQGYVYTRLSMDVLDYCAIVELIEDMLGASPPAIDQDSLMRKTLGVELSNDDATATLAFRRPVKPEEIDEHGALRFKTFFERIVRLMPLTEDSPQISTRMIDLRISQESAWILKESFSGDLSQRILTHIVTTIR